MVAYNAYLGGWSRRLKSAVQGRLRDELQLRKGKQNVIKW